MCRNWETHNAFYLFFCSSVSVLLSVFAAGVRFYFYSEYEPGYFMLRRWQFTRLLVESLPPGSALRLTGRRILQHTETLHSEKCAHKTESSNARKRMPSENKCVRIFCARAPTIVYMHLTLPQLTRYTVSCNAKEYAFAFWMVHIMHHYSRAWSVSSGGIHMCKEYRYIERT